MQISDYPTAKNILVAAVAFRNIDPKEQRVVTVPARVLEAAEWLLTHVDTMERGRNTEAERLADLLAREKATHEETRSSLASKLLTITELEKLVAENKRLTTEITRLKATSASEPVESRTKVKAGASA